MSRQGPNRKRGAGAGAGGARRGPAGGGGRGAAAGGRSAAPAGRSSGGGRGARSSASRGRPRDDRQDIFDAPRAGRKDLGGDQVEGRQAVRELLIGGRRKVREVLFVSDLDPAPILDDIRELAESMRVPVREVSKAKFGQEARTMGSQGVVAHAAPIPETALAELIERDDGTVPFLLAMDGITDPGNLGAVIRTAECVGVTGVMLPRHRAAHITPTVTKAAAGAVEYVPMAVVGGLPTALATLREAGVWIVGLDGDSDQSVHEMTVASEPLCLVLGAEGEGLSKLVRQRCDAVLSIPMLGQLNSLNVSAAAAIACAEVARRRLGGS